MYIIAVTPMETYTADATTMTLYNSQGKVIVKGFLRIVATMWSKNIVALKRIDYNGFVFLLPRRENNINAWFCQENSKDTTKRN